VKNPISSWSQVVCFFYSCLGVGFTPMAQIMNNPSYVAGMPLNMFFSYFYNVALSYTLAIVFATISLSQAERTYN
jgi:hypothetical protein